MVAWNVFQVHVDAMVFRRKHPLLYFGIGFEERLQVSGFARSGGRVVNDYVDHESTDENHDEEHEVVEAVAESDKVGLDLLLHLDWAEEGNQAEDHEGAWNYS